MTRLQLGYQRDEPRRVETPAGRVAADGVLTAGQHGEQHERGGPQVGGRRAVGPRGRAQYLGRRVRHGAAHPRQESLARSVPAINFYILLSLVQTVSKRSVVLNF